MKWFAIQVKVDLVNFHSMPDGQFKHLIKYQYHGIKLQIYNPIVAKRASCVAYALMEIFMLIGPPVIPQSNNGREFSGMARHSSDHEIPLYDQFICDVISNIKNIWREVRIIWGCPPLSESNGGIKRINLTVEEKLGDWIKENNSQSCSVGFNIFQWNIKTKINSSIGNQIPYQLIFGQIPQVGISNPLVLPDLLDNLATEKGLNCTFNITEGQSIEDAHIELYGSRFLNEEVPSLEKFPCPKK